MISTSQKVYALLFLLFGVFIVMGNSSGRASRNQTNTGAPGDDPKVCQSCHNSADIQVKVGISIQDKNGSDVMEYIPGTTYNVKVTIDPAIGIPSGYGMQIVSISDSLFLNAGKWENITSPLNTVFNNRTQRNYVEHFIVSDENVFDMEWQAPELSLGPVSFYAVGAGVNRNQSSSGDGAGADKLTIVPGSVNIVNTIFPNPTTGLITFPSYNNFISLTDAMGRKVQITSFTNSLDLSALSAGVYWLQVRDLNNGEIEIHKILKI